MKSLHDIKSIMEIQGQTAILTGAAGEIGQVIAESLAQNGVRLLLIDQNPKTEQIASELAQRYSIPAHGLVINLREKNACEQIVNKCMELYSAIDILINNAALFCNTPLKDLEEAVWDDILDLDLKIPFILSQACAKKAMIPAMHGKIINISSQAGIIAIENQSAYCVAKAGLIALTRSCALEWGKYGISTSTIAPTVVDTESALRYWSGPLGKDTLEAIPKHRFTHMWEVAAACVYLASSASDMLNGTALILDGGYTIH